MTTRQSKQARREAAQTARQRRLLLMWGSVTAAILLGIGAFVLSSGGSGDEAAAELAPDFELENTSGDTVRLSDYRGQPVAVTFMHTY
jgi:cytochrome oxidase Cu insertion factor (SCO1/SenC/PrrC family)